MYRVFPNFPWGVCVCLEFIFTKYIIIVLSITVILEQFLESYDLYELMKFHGLYESTLAEIVRPQISSSLPFNLIILTDWLKRSKSVLSV